MESSGFKVQLEYFDARSRLTQRRIREDVQIDLRKVENKDSYAEIRIKGLKTADIFVTNTTTVVNERCSSNSLYLWVANYKCAIAVFGSPSVLKSIGDFFVQQTPVPKNKENLSPNKSKPSTPPNGKRGYGLIKDIFGSGYTPDSKARPGLKLGGGVPPVNTLEKEVVRQPAPLDRSNKPRQTTFMGLLAAASKPSEKAAPASPTMERFSLTETQNNVIEACRAGKNVFYTGGAGTGKSTLLTRLIELLVEQHGRKHVFVAATTGLAACAVGGTTVHQFAGISSVLDESSDASAAKLQFTRVVNQVRMVSSFSDLQISNLPLSLLVLAVLCKIIRVEEAS